MEPKLQILINDDGRGLSKALLTPKAQKDMPSLIRKGFSSRKEVDVISGRGMGLGAIYETVEKLGGQVELSSEPGKGTELKVLVPLQDMRRHSPQELTEAMFRYS